MFSNFVVHAADIANPLGVNTIGGLVTNILKPVYPIAGMVFLALLIYGGFSYMSSMNDPQKLSQARGILTAAVIGLVIILAAFLITNWLGNILGVDIAGVN